MKTVSQFFRNCFSDFFAKFILAALPHDDEDPQSGNFRLGGEKTAHGNNHYSVPKNNSPTPRNYGSSGSSLVKFRKTTFRFSTKAGVNFRRMKKGEE